MILLPRTAALLALAAAGAVAARLAGWWPCSESCQGGGHYRHLLGVPVLWPALVLYLALAGLAWMRTGGGLAWLLAGTSAFFLLVAWDLGLDCAFCRTVHGLVIASALLLRPWPGRRGLTAGLLGLLLANAAFHHRPVADLAGPEGRPGAAQDALDRRIDANRSRGRADAPVLLEAVLDPFCPHCAEHWAGTAALAAPAVADGRLRVTLRTLVRTSEPAGRDAARWLLAAAAESPAAHGRLLAGLLGSRSGLEPAALLRTGPPGLAEAAAAAERDGEAVDRVLDRDLARIRELRLRGATPLVVLSRDGREAARWQGPPDPAALAAALGP